MLQTGTSAHHPSANQIPQSQTAPAQDNVVEENKESDSSDSDYDGSTQNEQAYVAFTKKVIYQTSKNVTKTTNGASADNSSSSELSSQLTLQDILSERITKGDNQYMGLKDIIQMFQSEYYNFQTEESNFENNIMYQRIAENQKVIVEEEKNDLEPLSKDEQPVKEEEKMVKYLSQNSRDFKVVIGIKELARGGEAIVFKLDHSGKEEVVIKKSLASQKFEKDYSIREEIIEKDASTNLISNYVVIVEKARFSLIDLLFIWRDETLTRSYVEYYSPEKMAYYFFQAMQAIQFLHQRNFYYGDMKPHNLLVFKDQLVKIGDLGTSIKFDVNVPSDIKHYNLNGLSSKYAPPKLYEDFREGVPQSKDELIQADIHCLVTTFKECIKQAARAKNQEFKDHQHLCTEIMEKFIYFLFFRESGTSQKFRTCSKKYIALILAIEDIKLNNFFNYINKTYNYFSQMILFINFCFLSLFCKDIVFLLKQKLLRMFQDKFSILKMNKLLQSENYITFKDLNATFDYKFQNLKQL